MPRVAQSVEPRGRRRRATVRAANMAMIACIDDAHQPLVAEALARVINRQSQMGASLPGAAVPCADCTCDVDDDADADDAEDTGDVRYEHDSPFVAKSVLI